MDAIEKRARELLEIAASAEHYGIDYHEERLIREADVLAVLVEALTPPEGYVLLPVEQEPVVTAHWKDGRLNHILDCSPMPDGVHRLYAARPEVP